VVHASSAAVYGESTDQPLSETDPGRVHPAAPAACHAEGQRFAEALLTSFAGARDVDARVVRIFNTYGPRMPLDGGDVLAGFIVRALSGRELPIFGDGSQIRTFCYVDDVIAGCQRLMAASAPLGIPVNLGSPEEISIGQLAATVVAATRSRCRLEYRPRVAAGAARRTPDVQVAREQLGWSPRVGLREGLERTIECFVQRLNATPQPVGSVTRH
jgi:UDP-glucuronate decarboxylase